MKQILLLLNIKRVLKLDNYFISLTIGFLYTNNEINTELTIVSAALYEDLKELV